MKYFHLKSIIKIIGEKRVQYGSKGSRQWKLLKQFDGKTVAEYEHAAKQSTKLKSPGTYQQGSWWTRELDYSWKQGVIRIQEENAHNNSTIRYTSTTVGDGKHTKDRSSQNDSTIRLSFTASKMDTLKVHSKKINMSGTGIYIAYPTSPVLKPIYRGYKTKVNNAHTKVGIATDSFYARKNSYFSTFDGEVEFVPIAEIKNEIIEEVEQEILGRLSRLFRKVGNAHEWFDTDNRDMVLQIISEVQEQIL